jgi:protein-S-isoprenylcysteine O-methyltransferase Ste14
MASVSLLSRVYGRGRAIWLARSTQPANVDRAARHVLLGLALASLIAAIHSGLLMPLLLGFEELAIVVLLWFQRPNRAPQSGGRQHLIAHLLAWGGIGLPLLLRPWGVAPFPLATIGSVLQLTGSLLALVAALTLGRRFGIVAANRGLQTSGLYRLVRHPIYLAYLISNGGFVLAYPHMSNVAVLVLWVVVQAWRALMEERVLMTDAAYRAYTKRVRYRFVPGVW